MATVLTAKLLSFFSGRASEFNASATLKMSFFNRDVVKDPFGIVTKNVELQFVKFLTFLS